MNYGQYNQQYNQQTNQPFGLQVPPPNRFVPGNSSGLFSQPIQPFSNLYPNRNATENNPQQLQKYNNTGLFSNLYARNNNTLLTGNDGKDNNMYKLQRQDADIIKLTEEYYTYLQQYEKYQLIEKALENTLSVEQLTQLIQNLILLQKERKTSVEQDQNKAHLEFALKYRKDRDVAKDLVTLKEKVQEKYNALEEARRNREDIYKMLLLKLTDSQEKTMLEEYNKRSIEQITALKSKFDKVTLENKTEVETNFGDSVVQINKISSPIKPSDEEKMQSLVDKNKPFDKYCPNRSGNKTVSNRLSESDYYEEFERLKNNPFFTENFATKQFKVKTYWLKDGIDRNNFGNQHHFKVSVEDTLQHSNTAYPQITDSNFHEVINEIFTGQRGDCNYLTEYQVAPSKSSCGENRLDTMSDFHPYQRIVSEYISPFTPYRGILVYHSVGTGKTISSHGIAANFLKYDKDRTILYVVKPTLVENTYTELRKINDVLLFGKKVSADDRQRIVDKRIEVISYERLANRLAGVSKWDGMKVTSSRGYAAIKRGERIRDSPQNQLLNNTLIIIDEVQNIVKQGDVYPGKAEASIILASILYATDVKLALLTATPMRDHPAEVGVLLNLLIPPTHPAEYKFPMVFHQEEVELPDPSNREKKNRVMTNVLDLPKTQELFDQQFTEMVNGQRVIANQQRFLDLSRGLVSYYNAEHDHSRFITVKKMPAVEIRMTDDEFKEYYYSRLSEIELMKKQGIDFKQQDCLQAGIMESGDRRPAASCNDSRKFANRLKIKTVVNNIAGLPGKQFVYTSFSGNAYSTINLVKEQLLKDGWEFMQVPDLIAMIQSSYLDKSKVDDKDWIRNLPNNLNAKGQQFFSTPKKRFVYYNSDEIKTLFDQTVLISFYNMEKNIHGEYIKLIVGSSKIKEGISLFGLRGIHFVDYPTSVLDLKQVIGRATRDCSHKLLPFTEDYWRVDIYHYIITHEMLTKMVSKDYQNDLIENAINQVRLEMGDAMLGGAGKKDIVPENYCADLSLDECERVDACHIDAQSGACMMLNIDDTVQKMTIRYNKLQEDFLLLLQVNAIDCNVFKKFNQITDSEGRALTCHRPLNDFSQQDLDLSSVLHPDVSSEFSRSDIDCNLFGEDLCVQNPYCYWKPSFVGLYSTCKNRKKGRHFGCSKYYNTEDSCNADSLCLWKESKQGLLDFKSKKSCQEKYERKLDRYNHAVSLELAKNTYQLFQITEVSTLNNQDMKGAVKSYRDFISLFTEKNAKDKSSRVAPAIQLEILQNLIMTDNNREYLNYANQIKELIAKDQSNHPTEWLVPKMDTNIQQFLTFYDNFMNVNAKKTLNMKHYFILEWAEYQMPNLYEMSKTQDKMSYVLKFDVEGFTYYISSLEIKDACLSLNNVELLSTVTKTFQASGLFLTVIFYLKQARLHKITAEAIPNDINIDKASCYTYWTLIGSNDVVIPYRDTECVEMWEKNLLGAPPNLSTLTTNESKLQARECWSKWKKGVYGEPDIFKNKTLSKELEEYCKRHVTKSGKECNTNDDCWARMSTDKSCSQFRTLKNPYTCERRFPELWTKKCYVASSTMKGGKRRKRKQSKKLIRRRK